MRSKANRLLFTFEEEFFCIDIHAVVKIIEGGRFFRLPLAPPEIAGVINLKGDLIPAIDPACILNIRLSSELAENVSALILGKPPRLIGFPLPEQENISFIRKDEYPTTPLRKVEEKYIKGITVWRDNKIRILDWEQIVQDIYE
ncbi:MAG: chemotaxis protein CheW [Thermodesulfobacteriota bacterium]